MTAIPQMPGPVNFMSFFGRLVEKKVDTFVNDFSTMGEKAFLADLATQIHRSSQIAFEKHRWVSKSLFWSPHATLFQLL